MRKLLCPQVGDYLDLDRYQVVGWEFDPVSEVFDRVCLFYPEKTPLSVRVTILERERNALVRAVKEGQDENQCRKFIGQRRHIIKKASGEDVAPLDDFCFTNLHFEKYKTPVRED